MLIASGNETTSSSYKMSGPVLLRTSDESVHPFNSLTEFKIGRSCTNNLEISEQSVSRVQCIIRKANDHEWTIRDMSRYRTTRLNGATFLESLISSGDVVTLVGVNDVSLVFYTSSGEVPRKMSVTSSMSPTGKKRKIDEDGLSVPDFANGDLQVKYDILQMENEFVKKENSKLQDQVKELKTENEKLLCAQLFGKNETEELLVETHQDRNELIALRDEQRREIECLVKEKNQLCDEIEALRKAIQAQESKLHSGAQSAEITNQLIERDKVICTLATEKEKYKSDLLCLVEQEFICSICSDLLCDPVTMNCRHTFCSYCLGEWKKKKKECPECRTRVISEVQPIMLNRFLDHVAPLLGSGFTHRLEEIRRERAASTKKTPRTQRAVRGNRGNRGRARRGAVIPFVNMFTIDLTSHDL